MPADKLYRLHFRHEDQDYTLLAAGLTTAPELVRVYEHAPPVEREAGRLYMRRLVGDSRNYEVFLARFCDVMKAQGNHLTVSAAEGAEMFVLRGVVLNVLERQVSAGDIRLAEDVQGLYQRKE